MKYAWIEENREQFAVARMCRWLDVSRSGYLQWRARAPSDRALANAVLDAQVAAVHADSGCAGADSGKLQYEVSLNRDPGRNGYCSSGNEICP